MGNGAGLAVVGLAARVGLSSAVTWNVSVSRSPTARFASCAVTVTVRAPPVTLAMVSPAIEGLVTRAKLEADTPEAKVRPPSETVTVAPFRFASVSEEGLVAEMYAGAP